MVILDDTAPGLVADFAFANKDTPPIMKVPPVSATDMPAGSSMSAVSGFRRSSDLDEIDRGDPIAPSTHAMTGKKPAA